MKIFEIISTVTEVISVSGKQEQVKQAIIAGIAAWANDLIDKLQTDHESIEFAVTYPKYTHHWIASALRQLANDLIHEEGYPTAQRSTFTPDVIKTPNVSFTYQLRARGGVDYRGDIILNNKLLDPLTDQLSTQLSAFQSVDEIIIFLKSYRPSTSAEKKAISDLTSVFIHEMVHVQQQHAQARAQQDTKLRDTESEVRSYLIKGDKRKNGSNKRKYANMMASLSPATMHLYLASPQEIPAHAHTLALAMIDVATNGEDPSQTNINTVIYNLDSLLKDSQLWSTFTTAEQYKQFNKPGTHLYKIYKRFFKIVYQEITNYRTKLIQMAKQ